MDNKLAIEVLKEMLDTTDIHNDEQRKAIEIGLANLQFFTPFLEKMSEIAKEGE